MGRKGKEQVEYEERLLTMTKVELIQRIHFFEEDSDHAWKMVTNLKRMNNGLTPEFRETEGLRLDTYRLKAAADSLRKRLGQAEVERKEWKDKFWELNREYVVLKERSEREDWAMRGTLTLRGLL
jgi:hypothetical protein